MSILRNLRGQPRAHIPMLGQTLTLYRQGLLVGLLTVVLLTLPWSWIPGIGPALQALTGCIGFYMAATLIGSRAPTAPMQIRWQVAGYSDGLRPGAEVGGKTFLVGNQALSSHEACTPIRRVRALSGE